MKNNKFSSLLKEWYEGNLSFDERMNVETEKPEPKKEETSKELNFVTDFDITELSEKIKAEKSAYFTADYKDLDNPEFCFLCDNAVYHLEPMSFGYFTFIQSVLEDENIKNLCS